jgi:hypothetical protein
MSRSFKKVPGFSDSEGSKYKAYYLRLMNKRIRKLDPFDDSEDLSNGNLYRRYVETYDFRDYNFRFFSSRELRLAWLGRIRMSYKDIRK